MSGNCPATAQTHDEVVRWCQVQDWVDRIDYLHSSPAALAVVISIFFGVLAYLAKPVIAWALTRQSARARRRRLLKTFSLELRHSEAYLRRSYSEKRKMEWIGRFEKAKREGIVVVPFQPFQESDVLSSSLRAELPDFAPAIAELIIRYYATDSLLATAIRDLRADDFKALDADRQQAFYLHIFALAAHQVETCKTLRSLLGDNEPVSSAVVEDSSRLEE